MAIGNSGGDSAATRFRPRGTAPSANFGLGRRSLLADEGAEEGAEGENSIEDQNQNVEEVRVSTASQNPPARRPRFGGPRPSLKELLEDTSPEIAETPQPAAVTESLESRTSASATVEASSTSTDPSPSSTTQTSARRGRGRPPRTSTQSVATPSSNPDSTTALSVADARARMREIEAQAKQVRLEHNERVASVNSEYQGRMRELQTEYQACLDAITALTFGL